MSENNDMEDIKKHFINEYRKNGGSKDLSQEPIKIIMLHVEAQKEVNELKDQLKKSNSTPPGQKTTTFNSMNGGIDMGRYNAELAKEFADAFRGYHDYIDPPFDKRQIDDESFKRDNALAKFATPERADSVVILRDNEGRIDMGGPSKYKRGVPEWSLQ